MTSIFTIIRGCRLSVLSHAELVFLVVKSNLITTILSGNSWFMTVTIDCFTGIWTVFAFHSHTPFQYAPLMPVRWRQSEIQFSCFAQIRRFAVFVLQQNLDKLPWYALIKPSQFGIDRAKIGSLRSYFDDAEDKVD